MPGPSASRGGKGVVALPSSPTNYQFNLSPHKWSRPLDPQTIDSNVAGKTRQGALSANNTPDSFRRGKIWRWSTYSDLVQPERTEYNSYETTKTEYKNTGRGLKIPKQVTTTRFTPVKRTAVDNRFGFQFVWNPTTITSSVSLSTDINPSAADKFLGVFGIFQGQGSVSIPLLIDRTNDFANFRGSKFATSTLASYYESVSPGGGLIDASTKIELVNELMRKGTLADIEFLYSVANGGGLTGVDKGKSSDIGYLAPTAVRFDLGPMHYAGIINGVAVRHLAFTQDMIPIRSEVTIDLLRLANYGLNPETNAPSAAEDKKYIKGPGRGNN